MKNKRFKIVDAEKLGFGRTITIVEDLNTGVNYMLLHDGYGSGMTPLLDENGKPVITKKED